ncbi:MAG: DUF1343 domain-containing protein [Verrucomicrobiota bacterium]
MNRSTAALAILATVLSLSGCLTGPGSGRPSTISPPGNGHGSFMLGIDVLEAQGFTPLAGKRVGLILNQTSYNSRRVSTRIVLQRAPQVNLVALYAPEHGVDGKTTAGEHIKTIRDSTTGLIVHSLYGSTRKPSRQQLAGIDVLVFDLQDIGCRSYTYISTMARSMEACGELGIEFMVLDRPNPMGGIGVYGPPREKKWYSFVGELPVPYVHGMTTGELALMTSKKRWIRSRPQLTVIKMRGWNRRMIWQDTGLPWRPTSPNIPKATSPFYYAATGMLGGLSAVDIGIGTSGPFEYAGAEGVEPNEFSAAMNRIGFRGARFQPYHSSKRPGRAGARVFIDPRSGVDPVAIDVIAILELNRRVPGGLLAKASAGQIELFNKVYGSQRLEQALRRGESADGLIRSWQGYVARFRQDRQPFLLYP